MPRYLALQSCGGSEVLGRGDGVSGVEASRMANDQADLDRKVST